MATEKAGMKKINDMRRLFGAVTYALLDGKASLACCKKPLRIKLVFIIIPTFSLKKKS